MEQMFSLITFALFVLGAFYFILLRPVLKQQQRARRDLATLRPGDEVVLTSGLIGTVVDMQVDQEDVAVMTIELGGVKVRALPTAIAHRWGKAGASEPLEGEQQAEGGV